MARRTSTRAPRSTAGTTTRTDTRDGATVVSGRSSTAYPAGIKSTASIGGHPIHPMLIPLPITFLLAAFFTDLGYWWTNDLFWAQVSWWTLAAGVVTGALSGIVGAIDYFTIARARQHSSGWIHAGGNVVVLILALVNWLIRMGSPADAVLPWGMVLSAIVAILLLITGWAGGELVYRHKIGVVGHE
jgi:uncharacterized membrane protein